MLEQISQEPGEDEFKTKEQLAIQPACTETKPLSEN